MSGEQRNERMKGILSLGAAVVALAAAWGGTASAQVSPQVPATNPVPLAMSGNPSAPEQAIARQLYAEFLRGRPEAVVETALVDLNGDRVAEIAVRFRHPTTCSGDRCHTAVLRHDGRQWKVVFERRTGSLATADVSRGLVGVSNGMRELVADGQERWAFNANGYYPLLESVGEVFQPWKPASADATVVARTALADALGAKWAQKPDPRSIRFTQADIDVGGGRKAVMVQAEHPLVCSQVLGCPVALLIADGNVWRPVLTATSPGVSAVLPSATKGLRDIAMVDSDGYRTFQYDGRAYRLTATTYQSPVTAAP